jgi:sulfotransferase
MMTPVVGIVSALLDQMQAKNQGSVFISDDRRRRVVGAAIRAYYEEAADDLTIVDNNRGWCARLPLLAALAPSAKVICMVRNVAEIIDSLERLQAKNPFQQWLGPNLNLYDRIGSYNARDGLIGYAYNALREACWGPQAERLLLVQYTTLAQRPDAVMAAIHAWLSLPEFTYDFEHLCSPPVFEEFDARLGVPGLHRVRPRVEYHPVPVGLPRDVVARHASGDFWHSPAERNHVAMV